MKFTDIFKIKDLPHLEKTLKLTDVSNKNSLKPIKDCSPEELEIEFNFYDYFNKVIYDTYISKNNIMNMGVETKRNYHDIQKLINSLTEKEDLLKVLKDIKFALNIENENENNDYSDDSFKVLFDQSSQNIYGTYFDYYNAPMITKMVLRALKDKELADSIKELDLDGFLLSLYDADLDKEDVLNNILCEAELIIFNKNVSPAFIKTWVITSKTMLKSYLDFEEFEMEDKYMRDEAIENKKLYDFIEKVIDSIDYSYSQNIELKPSVELLKDSIKKYKGVVDKIDFLIANEIVLELQDFSTYKNIPENLKVSWMKIEKSGLDDVMIELPYPAYVIKTPYIIKNQKKYTKNQAKIESAIEDMFMFMEDYYKENVKFMEISKNEYITLLYKPFVEDSKENEKTVLKNLMEIIFEQRNIVKMVDKLNNNKEMFLPSLEEALQEALVRKSQKLDVKKIKKF